MSKTEFSIDEITGEVLQHDGFIRFVIAKSLYALVERLANTESLLINTNAQLAVKDTMLSDEMKNNSELQEEIATLKAALDASNAALAEARSFVFDLAAFHSQDTSESKGFERDDLLAWVNAAKNLSGFWVRAAVVATTQDESESGE